MNGNFTCGFLGLGLIGGSIARALRQFYPNCKLIAWDVNEDSLALAIEDGVLNLSTPLINSEFSKCDYIFLCAPVTENAILLNEVQSFISKDCILTDVGSVKTNIHQCVEQLGLGSHFIGGHPMAGSERTGYINSRAVLLENAYYILTPSLLCSPQAVARFRDLIASLGALPIIFSCEQHDYVTAAVSHLPHIVAASLVNLIRDSDSPDGLMKMIAAGGFKDITRIASSSPQMWQQICLVNHQNISILLEEFIAVLSEMKRNIDLQDADDIFAFFENSRNYRDSFLDAPRGPIKKSYSLKIEIADQPGALASIATLLAKEQISIKNIGIAHNREQTDGVLQVEFYQEDSISKAESILLAKGYDVFL